MRIDQLAALVEVAKSGSINSASKKLHVTQQSLNKSLKSLENEMNCHLLDRTKKGIRLTADGEKVLSAAQDVISRLAKLERELKAKQNMDTTLRGNLNVNLSPMLNISVLPVAFKDFISHYPEVNLFTAERYRDNIIERCVEHQELGMICVSPLITEFFENIPEEVELIALKQYPIYIAVSAGHPLADHKSLSISTIGHYPFVVYEIGGTGGIHAFQKLGHTKVALSTNNYKLCEEMLRNDTAIMYSFPPYLERNVFPSLVHIPVKDKQATFTIYAAVNKNIDKNQLALARKFIHVFSEYL